MSVERFREVYNLIVNGNVVVGENCSIDELCEMETIFAEIQNRTKDSV